MRRAETRNVLVAAWPNDGQPLRPVAYSVGGYLGPILLGDSGDRDAVAAVLAKLGEHGEGVEQAYRALPEVAHADEYDWQARDRERERCRAWFALGDDDADAARACGCLLELPAPNGRRDHTYVTDPAWLADRIVQKIGAYVVAGKRREREADAPSRPSADDPERAARREQRERDYADRATARARNLDLGAALARWEPKLDTEAVKLLGSLVLIEHGRSAVWAYRLCVEQPTTENSRAK